MRDLRLYVIEIWEAMIALQKFINGMDFEAFLADNKTSSAVVNILAILGESTKYVKTYTG